ncbi:DUF4430 domain-containing protein [Paenibacillus sp.]|uniref:DUF4430 domain-containing protein n=1 Tax=Paenibacillus sp. TaxID=58172 RepID=UPI00283AAE8E|nr:DUF4430 domain-containing protein [Paenibacillus sp.]
MKNKKWLYAALIVVVLAIAFVWGGQDSKKPAPSMEASVQTEQDHHESTLSPEGEAPPDGKQTAGEDSKRQTSDAAQVSGVPEREPEGSNTDSEKASDGASGIKNRETELINQTQDLKQEANAASASDSSPKTELSEGAAVKTASPNKRTDKAKGNGAAKAALDKTEAEAPNKTAEKTTDKGSAAKTAEKPEASSKPNKTDSTSAEAKPKKDKYQTEPVPAGKPKPVEWQDATINKKKQLTATLSVSAASILDHMDQFNKDKLEVLPKDGVIYKARKVTFYEGESVFDLLLREMKKNKIHMEFSMTPIYNSNYIEGINNLYEFDCGELSGWMYKVNGWFPNYGCSRYVLKDGDVVEWVYTCDLGRDVGGYVAAGGKP